MDRNALYNPEMSPEDAVIAMLGLPLREDMEPGDVIEILANDFATDADIGSPVPAGRYRVSDTESNLVHLIQFNPDTSTVGGKEYTIRGDELERLIASGNIRFYECVEEGRIRGTVDDPRELHVLFRKGYLQLFPKAGGGHKLSYRRRAHSKYSSGKPNPEYKLNRKRQQRRLQRERRKKIKRGAHVPRRKKKD